MSTIELNHLISHGGVTYKGLPGPFICDFMSRKDSKKNYDDNTSFQIGMIKMVGNTGTYIDTPFHRYENGKDLSEITLSQVHDIEGVLITVPYSETLSIDKSYFENLDLENKAVLVNTGWSKFWQTPKYFGIHPFLTQCAAKFLLDSKVKLVGIDSHNIDDTRIRNRPVHSLLLKNDILIVEHLTNLVALKGLQFKFSAIPPKVRGFGTFPVRAFATKGEE